MKCYKNSRYWVAENGDVFSKTPEYNKVQIKKSTGYKWLCHKPEKWKQLKHQYSKGYANIATWLNNKRVFTGVHRMVAECYCDGYFEGAHVDHIDNNSLNNHYTNLQWCSKEYNHCKSANTNFPLYHQWCKSL